MRRSFRFFRLAAIALSALPAVASLQSPIAPVWAEESEPAPKKFASGFPADAEFFPIGVWLQQPRNAAAYSAAGVNTYVGLWNPPSENDLAQLERGLARRIAG